MSNTVSFLNYLKFEKRYSVHTITSYSSDLRQFAEFIELKSGNSDLLVVDSKQIRSWVVYLAENNIENKSIRRKLTCLKSFYKYLQKENLIKINPVDKVIAPKIKKLIPFFVDQDNINSLLDEYNFGDDFEGKRNRLIIEFLYLFGLRRAELINLKTFDVNCAELNIKVTGKRNKERIIPFTESIIQLITEYNALRKKVETEDSDSYFFLSAKGNKLYENLVYRIVKKHLSLVTTIEKISPHVLRHTFATHMLNNGADLNAIKELLGHANLAATQVYTHNTFEKLKNVYKKTHPRA